MKFKKGQQVVCTYRGKWLSRLTEYPKPGPAFNEIVTVESEGYNAPGTIRLVEYQMANEVGARRSYEEEFFEPLITDAQLDEELSTIIIYETL